MYRVVVCSNCKLVWVVQGQPKTSQCRRCGRSRKLKKLKKYHKTDDKEEAKLARAFYQSRVNGQGDHFDRALEKGLLEEDFEAFMSEHEYLEQKGLDPVEVENTVEHHLSESNSRSPPQREIVRRAIERHESPTEATVTEYAKERGMSEEKASDLLRAMKQRGDVTEGPGKELRLV